MKKQHYTSPKHRYNCQKGSAQKRGIDWEFTFDTWWEIWQQSGKWEQRGNKSGQYVMCRNNDIGPYSPSNVRIDTVGNNCRERNEWSNSNISQERSEKIIEHNKKRWENESYKKRVASAISNSITNDEKQARSERLSDRWANAQTLICQHCGIETKSKTNFNRWHNNNCKVIKRNIPNE